MQQTAIATSSVYLLPTITFAQKDSDARNYQPQYFTAEEWDFINAITDQLIPEDELVGGALIAGFPEFIDRKMLTDFDSAELFYMHEPYHIDALPTFWFKKRFYNC